MATFSLVAHPDTPDANVTAISVTVEVADGRLMLRYLLSGKVAALALPQPVTNMRQTDELWRHSCFEAFVAGIGSSYREFNFAPGGDYAVYDFDGYRTGTRAVISAAPRFASRYDDGTYELTVEVALPAAAGALGLSAVIEAKDGTKSYWALAHAPGPPDFHNRDCFTAKLAAPDPS